MTAGLPGFGLGGVFFIISALLAPLGELVLTVRGRSSRARWANVGRQFLIAVVMICAVGGLLGLVGLVSGVGPVQGLTSFSLLPLIATASLLAFILITAKLVQLFLRGGGRGRPVNLERRRRRIHFERREPLGETEAS